MSLFLGHIYQDTIPDLIFVRDEATPLFSTSPSGGLTAGFLDKPNREVGDMLLVIAAGSLQGPTAATDQNWTLTQSFAGGNMGVYFRTATNDSNDDYSHETIRADLAGPHWCLQMISLGATAPGTITRIQIGDRVAGSEGNSTFDFLLNEMPVGPNPNNTFVVSVYSRKCVRINNPVEPGLTYNAGKTGIFKMTSNTADVRFPTQDHLYWCGWSSAFQEVSAVIPAELLTYTPQIQGLGGGNEVRTNTYRYALVP